MCTPISSRQGSISSSKEDVSDKPVQEQRSESCQIKKSNKVRDSGEARRRIQIVRSLSLERSSDLEVVSKDEEQREINVNLRDTTRPTPIKSIEPVYDSKTETVSPIQNT